MANSYQELIKELEEEVVNNDNHTSYNLQKEASKNNDSDQDILDDLNLKIEEIEVQTSKNIEKIASKLEEVDSINEIAKVAEELGDSDIANIVKVADVLSDVIADKVIEKVKNNI